MKEQEIIFDGDEGQLIFLDSAESMKNGHQSKKKEIIKGSTDNYVEAEFFGLKKFKTLVNKYKKDCVGFRVYYGSQFEDHSGDDIVVTDSGKKTARLIIVPVDQFGNDLVAPEGYKDMAGEPSALANGPVCPNRCAPPKTPPTS